MSLWGVLQLGQAAAKQEGVEAEGDGNLAEEVASLAVADLAKLVSVSRNARPVEDLAQRQGGLGASAWDASPPQDLVGDLVRQESTAERSLMHRFNIAQVRLGAKEA
jgi:hypothetical protein